MSVVEIKIAIKTGHAYLTPIAVPTSGFVMGSDDVIVSLGDVDPSNLASIQGNCVSLNTNAAPSDDLISIMYKVFDEIPSDGSNLYRIQGVLYKRTDVAGANEAPSRVMNITGVGTTELTVTYKLDTGGLSYEYYLLIQNGANGRWGLVDPRLVTNPGTN